ncbi:hypothetical protein [Enterobacter chengduensis]|uniref:hypothetical protein n=1 Tax=Enterobacter chengduensis TaxID=2494701 RepID=UPI003D6FCFD3
MNNKISLIKDINRGVQWTFEEKEIYVNYSEEGGGAVYSKKYKLVVVMNYKKEQFDLDMNVYTLDGEFIGKIKPHEKKLAYMYITSHEYSKSNVAVVAECQENEGDFNQWHFNVDLDNFKIAEKIAPAY